MERLAWPPVTVIVVTYDRPAEIRCTLDALLEHLDYAGPVLWHLADDGTPGEYLQEIRDEYPELELTTSSTPRRGWGANVNAALRQCLTPYQFLIEDDYVLRRPLHLTDGVALLEVEEGVGLVRYDGVEGHRLTLHLEETRVEGGPLSYAWIDFASPCWYVYSNRPHLRHERFNSAYGEYPEGLRLGATEEGYAGRVREIGATCAGPRLAILEDGIPRAFEHIGVSRQLTLLDTLGEG